MADKKKQPSTLAVVIGVLVFVVGATTVFSSGLFSFKGGAMPMENSAEQDIKNIYYITDGNIEVYKLSENQEKLENKGLEENEPTEIEITFVEDNNEYRIKCTKEKIVYGKETDENYYTIELEDINIDTFSISPNHKNFMVLANDDLYMFYIKNNKVDKYAVVDSDVSKAYFTVDSDFTYLKNSLLNYSSGGYIATLAEGIVDVEVSFDSLAVYYINNNKELFRYRYGGTKSENGSIFIGDNVTDMFYCGQEKLAFIKDEQLYLATETNSESLEIRAEELVKY